MAIHGSCLCGGIQYQIQGTFDTALNCHCTMCRRAHGAAFATFAKVNNAEDFSWVSGERLIRVYESSEEGRRCFCDTCGAQLGSIGADGKLKWLTLGTVTGDPGVRPEANMYVAFKAPWFEIADGLPQFQDVPSN